MLLIGILALFLSYHHPYISPSKISDKTGIFPIRTSLHTYTVDQLPASSIPHPISPKHTKGRKRRKARGKSYVCPLRALDPDLIYAADRWSLSSLPTEPKLYVRAAQLLGYEHMLQQPERIDRHLGTLFCQPGY